MIEKATDLQLIIGAGLSGQSIADYFDREGIAYAVYDQREAALSAIAERALCSEVLAGELTAQELARFSCVYVSPGVDINREPFASYRAAGGQCSNDIALFMAAFKGKIIAITGSNGKSTVTDCCAYLLQSVGLAAQACGNIGVPALSLLDGNTEIAVIELSSFQLEHLDNMHSDVAMILNLSPDHLDRHKTIASYHQAKKNIFLGAKCIIENADDPYTRAAHRDIPRISFSAHEPLDGHYGIEADVDGMYLVHSHKRLVDVAELKLQGSHNYCNALAALAACSQLGVDADALLPGLTNYGGLGHRFELVASYDEVQFINDSKATNVGATQAALSAKFPGRVHLLLGGDAKGGELSELASALPEKVRVYSYGKDSQAIANSLPVSVAQFVDLAAAFTDLSGQLIAGDTVLLSPACASLDQYKNYQARGHHFKQLVDEYIKNNEKTVG